jgi:hypothetical protein
VSPTRRHPGPRAAVSCRRQYGTRIGASTRRGCRFAFTSVTNLSKPLSSVSPPSREPNPWRGAKRAASPEHPEGPLVRRATPVAHAHPSQRYPHPPCAPGAWFAHRHLGGAGTAGRRGSARGASAPSVRGAGMAVAAGGALEQAFDSPCCAVGCGMAETPRGWRFACFLTAPAPEAHRVHRWGSGLGRRRALIVYVFVRHALAARLSQLRAAAAQRSRSKQRELLLHTRKRPVFGVWLAPAPQVADGGHWLEPVPRAGGCARRAALPHSRQVRARPPRPRAPAPPTSVL